MSTNTCYIRVSYTHNSYPYPVTLIQIVPWHIKTNNPTDMIEPKSQSSEGARGIPYPAQLLEVWNTYKNIDGLPDSYRNPDKLGKFGLP